MNAKRVGLLVITGLLAAVILLWAWQMRYAISGDVENFMTVQQAHAEAKAGRVTLVDVRRPSEWRYSGIPAGAHAITMHQDGDAFVRQLLAVTNGNKSRPLALICATGGRTTWLQNRLGEQGFTHLINVAEGMKGSRFGDGWVKNGLPVVPYK